MGCLPSQCGNADVSTSAFPTLPDSALKTAASRAQRFSRLVSVIHSQGEYFQIRWRDWKWSATGRMGAATAGAHSVRARTLCRCRLGAGASLPDVAAQFTVLKTKIEREQQLRQILKGAKMNGLLAAVKSKMAEYKIRENTYHTGSLNGTMCQLYIKNFHHIVEPLAKHPSTVVKRLAEKYQAVANLLLVIQSGMKSKFLETTHKERVKRACVQLPGTYMVHFPELRETPKHHVLIKHVKTFLDEWGTIGLFSEQGLETLHAHVNAVASRMGFAQMSPAALQVIMQELNARALILWEDRDVEAEKEETAQNTQE